jgi:peptidoglycan/LPS O-acetylase OafA/YrhL
MSEESENISYSIGPSFDFIPALEGLRAVSILLVMMSHIGIDWMPGIFGVTIFFFISGFLITRQLLAELGGRGTISLSRFYIRRLLRLYPALLVMIAVGGLSYVILGGNLRISDILSALFYVSNYHELMGGFANAIPRDGHPYGVLWSLAVEEHYYVLFPLTVLIFGQHRARFLLLLLVAIILIACWRTYLVLYCNSSGGVCFDGSEWRLLHATDTRADSILYGAVLATILGSSARDLALQLLRSRSILILAAGLLFLSLALRMSFFRVSLRFSVQGIALFFGLGSVLFAPQLAWVRRLLSTRVMLALGRWSYSLYLWHWIVLTIAIALLPNALRPYAKQGGAVDWLMFGVAVTSASVVVAWASYRCIEQPVLAIRRRFGPSVRPITNPGTQLNKDAAVAEANMT